MRRLAVLAFVLLAACAPPPPPHVRPASPTNPQILAVELAGKETPAFRFEQVRLRTGTREELESRTPVTRGAAIARISHSGALRVLFFLPGFDTTYTHGAANAVRIAQIVDPRTLVVYADWGSKGKALEYRRDGKSAARNAPAFEALLAYVRRTLPHEEIDVFAHSMGSRVAVQALAVAARRHDVIGLSHLILAAPDLSPRDYLAAMRVVGAVKHGTIYISRRDKALLLSAFLHFHHRLGQSSVEHLNLPRTDIIDVTAEDHTKLGHTSAIHDPALLRDIYQVVAGVPSPHHFWCRSKTFPEVWLYCPKG